MLEQLPDSVNVDQADSASLDFTAARDEGGEALGKLLEACRQYLLLIANQELDETTRRAIAESTGGRYFRARNTAELEGIYLLLDELESLAKTEDAATADRLCYPPEAVDSVRLAAWAACAWARRTG